MKRLVIAPHLDDEASFRLISEDMSTFLISLDL